MTSGFVAIDGKVATEWVEEDPQAASKLIMLKQTNTERTSIINPLPDVRW
jgi:hypothetical protein